MTGTTALRVPQRFSYATVALPTVTVDEAPAFLRDAGIAGIEWRVGEHPAAMTSSASRFLADNRCTLEISLAAAERARRLCEAAGVTIVGLAPYVAVGDVESLRSVVEMARVAGAPMVRLQPGRPRPGVSYRSAAAATSAFLAAAVPECAARGVKLVLEMHQDTVCPSASLAAGFAQPFDPADFGVIYDVGNLVFEGYEQHALGLELLGEHLAHVHLKNAVIVPPAERPGVWRPQWAALDDGRVDVPAFLELLRSLDYGGWISLEDLSTDRDPLATVEHNVAFLRSIGALAGAETRPDEVIA